MPNKTRHLIKITMNFLLTDSKNGGYNLTDDKT